MERTALVEERVDLPAGPPGQAEVRIDKPGRIVVATRSEARRLLVVNERAFPGWEARVDGLPVPVTPCYGMFLGCVVPAGGHEVHFDFAPRDFSTGRIVTAVCAALVAAWTLGAVLTRPNAPA
jgi:uncharacterized membrane protein YfhO